MPDDRMHGADSEGRGILLTFVWEVIFDSILLYRCFCRGRIRWGRMKEGWRVDCSTVFMSPGASKKIREIQGRYDAQLICAEKCTGSGDQHYSCMPSL